MHTDRYVQYVAVYLLCGEYEGGSQNCILLYSVTFCSCVHNTSLSLFWPPAGFCVPALHLTDPHSADKQLVRGEVR